MLSLVTSLGREAERGTWNLTFPDASDLTVWHLVTHKWNVICVASRLFSVYGHIITILLIIDINV